MTVCIREIIAWTSSTYSPFADGNHDSAVSERSNGMCIAPKRKIAEKLRLDTWFRGKYVFPLNQPKGEGSRFTELTFPESSSKTFFLKTFSCRL